MSQMHFVLFSYTHINTVTTYTAEEEEEEDDDEEEEEKEVVLVKYGSAFSKGRLYLHARFPRLPSEKTKFGSIWQE